MSDLDPEGDIFASEPSEQARGLTPSRSRHRFALRAGVAVTLACALAAGSYGIASATSGSPAAAVRALAAPSTPSKAFLAPRAAAHGPFQHLGPWTGFGPSALGEGGTITGITATTITVETEFGGTLTVTTDSSTIYREGDTTVGRTALATGQEVLFQALFVPVAHPGNATALPVLGGSTAVRLVEIVLPSVSGKVVRVNGSQIVVAQLDGLYVTVNVSDSTTYEQAGQPDPTVQVQAGTVVSVTGTLSSDHTEIDATTVDVILASVEGRVTDVAGTTISLSGFGTTTETVTTDSSTVFRDQKGKTTIASVAKADFVQAWGTPGSGDTFAAAVVFVGPVAPSPVMPPPIVPLPVRPGGTSFPGGPSAGFGGPASFGPSGGSLPETSSESVSTPL